MTKKHRTGLQSKISHIFSGVPIPKKSRSRPKPEKPESEQDSYELTLSEEEETQIEETVTKEPAEEQPVTSQLPDDEPLVVEQLDEQSTEVEDKSKEDVAPKEQIQEASIDEPVVEEPVLEIQDETSPSQEAVIEQQPELKETSEKQVTPKPIPKEPEIAEPVDVPPVKEPVIEKPAAAIGSKFDVAEVEEPVETQKKPPLSRTLKADVAKTRAMQVTRKAPKRLKGKRVTAKPATSPTRQKTMIALVIVLSIVLVILVVKPFSRFSQNNGGSTGSAANGSQVSSGSNFQAIEIDWPEPPVYNSGVLRDPMELGQATRESKELIVKGISVFQGKLLATIGEDQYQVNEEVIPGVKIIEITENYVKFERDGESWTQNIGE